MPKAYYSITVQYDADAGPDIPGLDVRAELVVDRDGYIGHRDDPYVVLAALQRALRDAGDQLDRRFSGETAP